MRGYIFTEVEGAILDAYLSKGFKVKDWYVLLTRIRMNYPRLKKDFEILETIIEKEGDKGPP
jgi:hypothetical protein